MNFTEKYGKELRDFTERLLTFETTSGNEKEAQEWLSDRLNELGFEVYTWTADADKLAESPTFPNAEAIDVDERPSVAGVLEFGDPEAGPTIILNGHIDVVPVEESAWETDPFEPTWDDDSLTARGAVDMKSNLAACIFAAKYTHEVENDLDGRVVVESVVGEEEGGIGAVAAALSNPYPFKRDAAIITEPTELDVVTAVEGSVMMNLEIEGRSAHAATRWEGESVLPHFERIRTAFRELEADRNKRVTHSLYESFPISWPVNFGAVNAGSWASSVPAHLSSEIRIGVAPGETNDEVETEFRDKLNTVVTKSDWLSEHLPTFERRAIQFEPAEIDADERIVTALQTAMRNRGLNDTEPRGATYGADSRHYIAVGIPTVLFGAGSIKQAHFPNETIEWPDVLTATGVLADATVEFLSADGDES
ncbi:4-acetamidobutyryl-CoA deacetylase [Haladaptatus litoreus]|uniref:4-acetamidobutyryl-CoA deacetylase n=1 Tax=Haladaptatus litoreus TaxID=553468 RepID=A0A1N7CVP0_9EURY|nr:ArgE/DapE family deacylase [Haladaptatus litoreus]SIR67682.1 4-acetamidobutyryl-CoA deacetylase [Haladaptatus litoreus]